MSCRPLKFPAVILVWFTTVSMSVSEEADPKREPLLTFKVRTTAYTHSESDHVTYGNKTALGTVLRYTPEYHSAAADWSYFPLGTKFKIKGYDRLFVVDDYGSALVGKPTLDIYFTTKKWMNNWGVRHVEVEVIEFGSFHESRKILAGRGTYPHCLAMLRRMTQDNWYEKFQK
ncbi:MAG: 3D domain-containing protein [Verrucomicrobiales bacterium]|nr:3D domain-containing protein [Verrucomicrobiales bacterium]